jgi:hypothetical protein
MTPTPFPPTIPAPSFLTPTEGDTEDATELPELLAWRFEESREKGKALPTGILNLRIQPPFFSNRGWGEVLSIGGDPVDRLI